MARIRQGGRVDEQAEFPEITDPKQRAYVTEYAQSANHTLAAKAAGGWKASTFDTLTRLKSSSSPRARDCSFILATTAI